MLRIFNNSFLYRTHVVAAYEFFTKLAEKNCEENLFLAEFFSEISYKSFPNATFLKMTHLQVFRSFCLFLKLSEAYLESSETSRWSLCKNN